MFEIVLSRFGPPEGIQVAMARSIVKYPAACGKARHRARAAAQREAGSGTGGSWSVTGGGSGVTGGGGVIGGSVATGGNGVTGSSVVTGGSGVSCGSGVTGGSGCGARLWPPGLHFEGPNLSQIGPQIALWRSLGGSREAPGGVSESVGFRCPSWILLRALLASSWGPRGPLLGHLAPP